MAKTSDPTHARTPATEAGFKAEEYEQENVHSVYESIASHFSNTRYRPWPLIPAFLNSLPPGSVGADLGSGNGKYLSLRSVLAGKVDQEGMRAGNDIATLGLDRSAKLVEIASESIVCGDRVVDSSTRSHQIQPQVQPQAQGTGRRRRRNEVGVGDAIRSSYRSHSLDYALSIATIHHFSTAQRRVQAVEELIRIVRPITPQEHSRIIRTRLQSAKSTEESDGKTDYSAIAQLTTGRFLIYVWALEQRGESRRRFDEVEREQDEVSGRDLLVPWVLKSGEQRQDEEKKEDRVFQRYYHVFEQGELESLVEEAGRRSKLVDVHLEASGWEKGNWYGIWQCVQR